jgi:Fe2+ transport system protein FeoA
MIFVIICKNFIRRIYLKLIELKKGQSAIVKKIEASYDLKRRFFSLGLIKGAKVEVVDCSLAKSTIELKVEDTLIALRDSEAKAIEVEILNETD